VPELDSKNPLPRKKGGIQLAVLLDFRPVTA
jgi:hypothetical protein